MRTYCTTGLAVAALLGLAGCAGQAADATPSATKTQTASSPSDKPTASATPSATTSASASTDPADLDYTTMESYTYVLASGLGVNQVRADLGAAADPWTDEQIINSGKAACEALRGYASTRELILAAGAELPYVPDAETVTSIAAPMTGALCPGLVDRIGT